MSDRSKTNRRLLVWGLGAAGITVGVPVLVRKRSSGGRAGTVEVNASVSVRRSPKEVYEYWRDFEKLPTFMRHLQSVDVHDDGRSTWTANAPVKKRVTWQAEMTGDEPGKRISWKSLPGSDVDNSGTVHFAETPDGSGTEVRVSLHYDVPGGAAGRAVARLLGEEPSQQVRDDLRRLKQIVETGDVVRSDALPDGADAGHQMSQRPAQPTKDSGEKR